MRGAGLGQRVLVAGNGADLAGLGEFEQFVQRVAINVAGQGERVRQPHSGDRGRVPKQVGQLDRLRLRAARHTVKGEAAERRERGEALVGGRATDHVQHDVDPAALVRLAKRRPQVRDGRVDGHVRAEFVRRKIDRNEVKPSEGMRILEEYTQRFNDTTYAR